MTDLLKRVVRRLEALPEDDQDRQAALLLEHLDALETLRRDVQVGLDDMEAGRVVPFDAEDIIQRGMQRASQAVTAAGNG